jgi:hypothetical protein
VQQGLGGVGAGVSANEHGWFACIEDKFALARGVLLTRAVKLPDRAAVVCSAQPYIPGAELESRQVRLLFDGVQGGEQNAGINAVAYGFSHLCHVVQTPLNSRMLDTLASIPSSGSPRNLENYRVCALRLRSFRLV